MPTWCQTGDNTPCPRLPYKLPTHSSGEVQKHPLSHKHISHSPKSPFWVQVLSKHKGLVCEKDKISAPTQSFLDKPHGNKSSGRGREFYQLSDRRKRISPQSEELEPIQSDSPSAGTISTSLAYAWDVHLGSSYDRAGIQNNICLKAPGSGFCCISGLCDISRGAERRNMFSPRTERCSNSTSKRGAIGFLQQILCCSKKDGSLRPILDLRALNCHHKVVHFQNADAQATPDVYVIGSQNSSYSGHISISGFTFTT